MSALASAKRARARALRAQAEALIAEAVAEDAAAAALESTPATLDSANPATWPTRKTCGLPPSTVDRLIRSGDLRAAKIGREHRLHPDDLRKVLAAAVVAPKNAETTAEEPEAVDPFERARQRARARRAA